MPKFVGEGPVPVMPSAPTKGTPVEASYETMPYAPVGTPAPEPYVSPTAITSTTEPTPLLDINTIDPSVPGRPDFDPYLAALEAAAQTQRDVAMNPNAYQLTGNDYSGLFLLDDNLANLEEIADKIDMDEVAKIDIEKIDIPESVSVFSDILNEPVTAEPVIAEPTLPSIFDQPTAPVMPTMPMEPMVQPITAPVIPAQTLPQNIFADASKPQPLPMPVIPRIVEPRPIPAFVQPSVEEIVSPIRTGRTLPSAPRGLFSL